MVVLLAVGAGGAAWAARGSGATTTSALATVSRGTIRQTVSATGTLQPARQADLSFVVGGRVTSVAVAAGDKVSKGHVLATIGRSALRADLASARASVTAAREQRDSDQSSSASDTQLAADEASLRSARSARSSAVEALANARLRSTVSGTVASVDLSVGDQVSGSGGSSTPSGGGQGASSTDSSSAATTTGSITVISTDSFVVDASVSASDLAALKKGLQAQITPTGAGETIFGTVSSVGFVAESSTSGTSTFPVTIAVTGKVTGVYAGSSAAVSIIVRQVPNVLTVPTAAVRSTNGRATVVVSKNGAQHVTAVTLGTVYGAQTEVTKGLKVGDQVVVAALRLPGGFGTGAGGRGQGGFPGAGQGGFPGAGQGGFPGGGTGGTGGARNSQTGGAGR